MNDISLPEAQPESAYQFVEQYMGLQSQLDLVRTQQENATAITAPLFAGAVQELESKLAAVEQEKLVNAARSVARVALSTEMQLAELQQLVEQGYINPTAFLEAQQQLTDLLENDAVLQRAYVIAKASGATSLEGVVEVTEIETREVVTEVLDDGNSLELLVESATLEVEPESAPPKLKINILNNRAISIGELGKFIAANTREREGTKEHASIRIALLKAIILNPGYWLTPREIWAAAFDDKKVEFDKGSFYHRFKPWIDELTYNDIRLIEHNNKRGQGSKYRVNPSLDLSFEVIDNRPKTSDSSDRNQMPIVAKDSILKPDAPLNAYNKKHPPLVSASQQIENDSQTLRFPLNNFETAVIAGVIDGMAEVIEKLGLRPLRLDMDSDLIKSLNDHVRLETMHKYDGDMGKLRLRCVKSLQGFFNNRNLVMQTISEMDPKDNRYKIFEYLFDIESDKLWTLLSAVISEPIDQVVTVNRKLGDILEVKTVLPPTVKKIIGQEKAQSTKTIVSKAGTSLKASSVMGESSTEGRLKQPVISSRATEQATTSLPIMAEEVIEADKKETNGFNASEFRKSVGEAIEDLAKDKLLQNDDPVTLQTLSIMARSRKMGTVESYKRLAAAGLASEIHNRMDFKRAVLSPIQIVAMFMMNAHQNIVGATATRGTRRNALDIIEKSVEAYMKKLGSN